MKTETRTCMWVCTCVLVLGLVLTSAGNAADPGLVGRWGLDEGSGTIAHDVTGNGNDGTLRGNSTWAVGYIGGALEMDGVGDYVECGNSDMFNITEQITLSAWLKPDLAFAYPIWSGIIMRGGPNNDTFALYYDGRSGKALGFKTTGTSSSWMTVDAAGLFDGQWHHVAAVYDGTVKTVYLDGQAIGTTDATGTIQTSDGRLLLGAGRDLATPTHYLAGLIDDARVFNKALTEVDILETMEGADSKGYPYASGPFPADGAVVEETWMNFSWKPGDFAVSHDLYLGDNYDDVNDGTGDTFRSNQATTTLIAGFPGFVYPDGLVPGTTYYWRIDEVNEADPNSPWKGGVWSFVIPPRKAYDSQPADGAKYIDPNVTLSWSAGMKAKLHHVYFGSSFTDVDGALAGQSQTEMTYTPGPLEVDKTYYWRIDEFDGITAHKGDVWTFKTVPVIAIGDPNIVGWWTFDEGAGTTAIDWSGYGNQGTLFGPRWDIPGLIGYAALNLNGGYVAIKNLNYNKTDIPEVTVCTWIRTTGSPPNQYIASFDRDNYWRLEINGAGAGPGQVGWDVMTSSGQVDSGSVRRVDNNVWHHVCGVFDNGRMTIYIDGTPEPSVTGGPTFGTGITRYGFIGANSEATSFNGNRGGGNPVGEVDDFRIYNKALTAEEIELAMKGDLTIARDPKPENGSTQYVKDVMPLSWSAGDKASQHDVYFGTDQGAVISADSTDVTGIYRGRQGVTSYTPPEGVEWGGGPYYWRVDEYNTDGTISKGTLWSFSVADYLEIDSFDGYTDNELAGEAIWQTWLDGYGVPDNGAQASNEFPPYAEQTIIHSGLQSMPFRYNNTSGVVNSEAERPLTDTRDFTDEGIRVLSIWFRGYPPYVGSFTESPAGTYTLTGSGADIGNTDDQFHFAYKMLTGAGSIIAKVESVEHTHDSARAGVMIRETLDPNSKNAFVCIIPNNGVVFQGRTTTGGTSYSATQSGIAAPHWIKLERDVAGNFTAYHSTDGSSWEMVENSVPTNILMNSNTYLGLAVTSHSAAVPCRAVFSNVQIIGTVGGQWTHQDVGIASNAAEPMYVALSNSTGTAAVVFHDDPGAATINTWTEWTIDLQKFADQGLDLTNVDKIALGLGSKGSVTGTDGTGTMYFDDIRLYRPAPIP